MVSITPVQAAPNATLGDLTPASPAANKYAGCVASVLTGSGVTFGSSAALSADLAALWPTLPAGVADTCKQAVDGNQPQVCVNPVDPATCPAIGAATAAAAADLAASPSGDWKIVTDGVATGGYAQAVLATTAPWAPMTTVTGTFTTPTSVCTTPDCTVPPAPGLWTDCGSSTCGQVTTLTVSVLGRTPNGENSVKGHLQVVDGFGNSTVVTGIFGGSTYWGYGCTGECTFTSRLPWTCKDLFAAPASCGGQTLTVSFTFDSGAGGDCGCAGAAPTVGQIAEIQLTAGNLNFAQNATVCAGMLDCMRYDDSRLSYLDGSARPTVVLVPAPAPSAVIDLAAANIGCLVGIDVRKSPAVNCMDVTGAFAPLVQTAHGPVAPAAPPTVSGSASPSGGWEHTPVTVSLTGSADTTRTVQSISYNATGAQATPDATILGATAQVVVSADGATTLFFWATDNTGATSAVQSISVQVDRTAPAVACAAPNTAWGSADVTVACTAGDSLSGLATPTQAQLSLTTAVPAGTETAAAATNSVTVCDVAGNCATAGPITGLKVDRLGPSITITAPTGGPYTVGQVVNAAYSCADGGSGVASCTGTKPSGTAIDTATAGTHSFTVDATDAVGNPTQKAASYSVTAPIPTPTPTPAPKPVCNDNETGNHDGDHHSDCEKHGVAVRPIATPRPTPAPKHKSTPKPEPTHKPATDGSDKKSTDQKSGDQKSGDQEGN